MDPLQTSDATAQQKWVDSVYNSLSLEERIGQLYMASIWSQNDREADSVRKWIDKYHIGGLIFPKEAP